MKKKNETRQKKPVLAPRRPGVEKSIVLIVVLTALTFVAVSALMSQWSIREMGAIVRSQFNQEQMVIGRNVKYYIENQLNIIKREVKLTAKELEKGATPGKAIRSSLDRLIESGVFSMEVRDLDSCRVWSGQPFGRDILEIPLEKALPFPSDIAAPLDSQQISLPQVLAQGLFLTIVSPVSSSPKKYVTCRIKLSWFLNPYLTRIRSGKTGYAWVIDGRGRFLFHPDVSFIGESAFLARKERSSDISFVEINTIQKNEMLKGQEGFGHYISGWHRGLTGKMEKLIAYTPISIGKTPLQNWSVAVVAPVMEIEQGIKKRYMRQFFVQLGVVFTLIVGSSIIMFLEVKWSRRMEKEVSRQSGERVKSESRYRSLVESAEDIIFTVDRQAVLLSMNGFTARFFGCRTNNQTILSLFPQATARELDGLIKKVFQKASGVRKELGFTLGKSQVVIDANLVPVRNQDRPVSSVLCIGRDITERKKMERHLVRTEKMASLGILAAGVAHEINNPLGVILGFSELMLRKKPKDSQEYEDLKIIERQGFHCKEIVENLLDFVRTGEESDYRETVVNSCLDNAIKIIRYRFEKEGIELKLKFDPDLPPVKAGVRKLQQVFLNLINNAVDAMPNGGCLTIETLMDHEAHMVAVRFKDQGTAIGAGDMNHIFEPFFTTKPEGKGTGLGLFVSYGIITGFGGSLECDSKKPGPWAPDSGGTTFTVKLMAAGD